MVSFKHEIGYNGPEAMCLDRTGNTKTIIKQVHGISVDGMLVLHESSFNRRYLMQILCDTSVGGFAVTAEGSGKAGSLFAATVDLGPYFVMA
jgi:hypothetical protein